MFRKKLRSPQRSRHGFTLIELIVVMTVLTILIAAAVPMFRGDASAKLRTAVRQAGAIFEQARSLALTRSAEVRVMVLDDAADEARHLRELAIGIREGEGWEIVWGPEFLPEGVVFDASQPGTPTGLMAAGTEGGGMRDWRYFVIGSNGTFAGTEPNFVVALGFFEGGAVRIPNQRQVDGFRITAASRPFYFRSPDEIAKNLPEP